MTRCYPCIIGRINVSLDANPPRNDAIMLGSVDVANIEACNPEKRQLLNLLSRTGFQLTECTGPYSSSNYCYGDGSVELHDDLGLNLNAAALVLLESLPGDLEEPSHTHGCSLIAGGKVIPLEVGDVFVFNADRPHAWLTNRRWAIITQCVSPRRVKA